MLANTRCLLLGAGTLGCGVARNLLSWGITKITFVDNGRVSYSNPVRQNLFTFNDCLNGGSHKAVSAAKALKSIFPGVEANAEVFTIPMPGHPSISPEEQTDTKRYALRLLELITSHDVVFMLMDSRESRWLPTVICSALDKLAVNAALGLDSFLVIRHGGGIRTPFNAKAHDVSPAAPSVPYVRLGCYFCNDVVAPENSKKDRCVSPVDYHVRDSNGSFRRKYKIDYDFEMLGGFSLHHYNASSLVSILISISTRTLDQQCTVTRPGLSPLACALAVELVVIMDIYTCLYRGCLTCFSISEYPQL